MIITMLAIAMTLAMLIATAIGLHEEAERMKLPIRRRQRGGFDPR
jgi:hypothetical protein